MGWCPIRLFVVVTPFLLERRFVADETLLLHPSVNVVVALRQSQVGQSIGFVFPHRNVVVVAGVVECASLSPNVIKCLVGEPRRFVGAMLDASQHPMLSPFAGIGSISDAGDLLEDLRSSLEVTPDEQDFETLWRTRGGSEPVRTGDRRVQRLCLRYAGQAPSVINSVERLARTLDADNASGMTNGLGEFADASHFGRVCKAYTGRTPGAWKNMSQTFY